ncbi:heme ABC transporter ATP-binding protein [Nitrincola tibetensis]|uniref:Heme ABC transporter ATP-binding protein n=1 Tax=Nitrincola tibetensis TaxID=2219697 RepID=A0A364NKW4_9GAMM|nr:heme ABC transporter ATP-binding protein [Nitrincola tibetensis]RAU17515.1 heme ABC transporter ATP-binding protein [Nitrincola tibetensis]
MLCANQLHLSIGQKIILDDVSLTLKPGEMLAVLGPNGAGKSTLLKALSGDIAELAHSISLNGKRLKHWAPASLAQYRAVMPQFVQLTFAFSVEEVIETSLRHPMSNALRNTHIQQMLSLFDAEHLRHRNYLSLSGGEQQRVQLARVISQLETLPVQEPQYLLLDECTSSLDLTHQHQVFQVLKKMAKQKNRSVLVILHDLNLAAQYADRILLMKAGRAVALGGVKEVLDANQLSEVYEYPIDVIEHPGGWPLVIPAHYPLVA